jgi:hemolysin III
MRSFVISLARRAEAEDHDICRESRPEEWANAATHGLGIVFAIAALALALGRAAETQNALAVFSAAIYGLTLVACFYASTLYHGCDKPEIKRTLLACDHCAIFIAIAGTYTPIALLAMPGWPGPFLLIAIWALALAGVALRLLRLRYMHPLFAVMFFVMGWIGFVFSPTLTRSMGEEAVTLILVGCLCCTGGIAFYGWKGIRFHHALWHVAALAGAVVHFIVIYDYVLPSTLIQGH